MREGSDKDQGHCILPMVRVMPDWMLLTIATGYVLGLLALIAAPAFLLLWMLVP